MAALLRNEPGAWSRVDAGVRADAGDAGVTNAPHHGRCGAGRSVTGSRVGAREANLWACLVHPGVAVRRGAANVVVNDRGHATGPGIREAQGLGSYSQLASEGASPRFRLSRGCRAKDLPVDHLPVDRQSLAGAPRRALVGPSARGETAALEHARAHEALRVEAGAWRAEGADRESAATRIVAAGAALARHRRDRVGAKRPGRRLAFALGRHGARGKGHVVTVVPVAPKREALALAAVVSWHRCGRCGRR